MSQQKILVLYFVLFLGFMYFVLIRPQQKKAKQRQALLSSLKVRDRVTVGGIYGKIVKVKDNSVILQIADKVEVEVAKSGITSLENRDVVVEKDKKNDKNDKGIKLAKEDEDVKSEA